MIYNVVFLRMFQLGIELNITELNFIFVRFSFKSRYRRVNHFKVGVQDFFISTMAFRLFFVTFWLFSWLFDFFDFFHDFFDFFVSFSSWFFDCLHDFLILFLTFWLFLRLLDFFMTFQNANETFSRQVIYSIQSTK